MKMIHTQDHPVQFHLYSHDENLNWDHTGALYQCGFPSPPFIPISAKVPPTSDFITSISWKIGDVM